MGTDIQLLGKNLSIATGLVQHINEVAVLKDILNLTAGKQIFDVLCNTGGNAAPLSETLPDFNGISRRLLLTKQQMELVHIISGCFTGITVGRYTPPDLILNNQHTNLF